MAVLHQEIVRTDHRVLRNVVRAMYRHVLAKNVVVANAQPGRLDLILQILRRFPKAASGEKVIVSANGSAPREIYMRTDDAVGPEFHAFIDHGVRPYSNARLQLRVWMNDRCRVNHRVKSGTSHSDAKPKIGRLRCASCPGSAGIVAGVDVRPTRRHGCWRSRA